MAHLSTPSDLNTLNTAGLDALQAQGGALRLARDLEACLMRWRAQLCEERSVYRPLRRLLAPLLSPVRQVQLKALSHDDLAVFEGERLIIDEGYFLHTLARYSDHHERLIHASLYAVHEVIHHAHRLNDKRMVLKVRQVSEQLLMRFDLEADHHAALAVSSLMGEPLLGLKRRQVECLSSFPVTRAHSAGARQRKAGRYVSLCAEVCAREQGHLGEGAGFLMASWAGDQASLIECAEVMALLSAGELAEGELSLIHI